MFKHLLVPLDGSRLAEAALPLAQELAQRFGSNITLLCVPEIPLLPLAGDNAGSARYWQELRQTAYDDALGYLKKQKAMLDNTVPSSTINVQVLNNMPPADAILYFTETAGADSIVMSTHGRGGFQRWVYGSVASKVLSHSVVPILLVRAQEEFDFELPKIRDLEDIRSHELV